MKASIPWSNPVADALSYSNKCNGRYGFRSSTTADGSISRRFIAPPDFIQQMADTFPGHIKFGSEKGAKVLLDPDQVTISTIPMPALMSILGYPDPPQFTSRKAWVIEVNLGIESTACATLYYPNPRTPITRATLTETKLQIELMQPAVSEWDVISKVVRDFGIDDKALSYSYDMKEQDYGKIEAIDDRVRRKFIMWATDNFNTYCLGRFATWKPGLLLDDVLGDLFKIRKMIQSGDNYHGRLPSASQTGEE